MRIPFRVLPVLALGAVIMAHSAQAQTAQMPVQARPLKPARPDARPSDFRVSLLIKFLFMLRSRRPEVSSSGRAAGCS